MQSDHIQALLEDLGNELEQKHAKEPLEILLIGGAYMLLFVQNRDYTEDVDVFPLSFAISSPPSKEIKLFESASRAVAKRHGLKRDWINTVAASMLGGLGPEPE